MRIRDIARIGGFPCGEYNAVTDVKGVRVGHSTVIKDGAGPVEGIARTGVTVVLPAGDIVENAMYAGVFSLNGNGELSGCHWIEESGLLTTPIALTNTHSLGIVRDAMIDYYARLRKTDGPRTGCFRSWARRGTAGFPTSTGCTCGPSICAPRSIRRRPARWRKAASAAAPA